MAQWRVQPKDEEPEIRCPICGEDRDMMLTQVNNKRFRCKVCNARFQIAG